MTTGTIDGIVMVMDAKNMSWRHITKTPINLMKKILDFIQVSTAKTKKPQVLFWFRAKIPRTPSNLPGGTSQNPVGTESITGDWKICSI